MSDLNDLFGSPSEWSKDDTEKWLTKRPLPADFRWRGTEVCPSYRLHKGYGFWLRTSPYHRGLFDACHQLLAGRTDPDLYPNGDALAQALQEEPKQRSLFES